jgi:hypothetical protein
VAKNSIYLGHHIQFQDTCILAMKSGCMNCIIREEKEIHLCPNNMNTMHREAGFSLSKSQNPLLKP